MRGQLDVLGAVAAGGALGAPARYGLAQLISSTAAGYPWSTFTVNMTGSFALGLLLGLALERFPPSRYLRPFLGTGFLGAYTTYSTFALEADLLVKDGRTSIALVYAAASLLGGCMLAWGGLLVARRATFSRRGDGP